MGIQTLLQSSNENWITSGVWYMIRPKYYPGISLCAYISSRQRNLPPGANLRGLPGKVLKGTVDDCDPLSAFHAQCRPNHRRSNACAHMLGSAGYDLTSPLEVPGHGSSAFSRNVKLNSKPKQDLHEDPNKSIRTRSCSDAFVRCHHRLHCNGFLDEFIEAKNFVLFAIYIWDDDNVSRYSLFSRSEKIRGMLDFVYN